MTINILYFDFLKHVVTWKLAGETHNVVCNDKDTTNYEATHVKPEGTGRGLLSPTFKCASQCFRDAQ
jgi:hypothetical protein